MKKNILGMRLSLALSAATLAGCSATYQEEPLTEMKPTYSIWTVENCVISAERAGITLSSDGRLSDNKFSVRITSDTPLEGIPLVRHTAQTRFVPPVEGANQHYSFEVPYIPAVVSRLEKEHGFLVVTYRPTGGSMRKMQAYFSTPELAVALKDLATSPCVK